MSDSINNRRALITGASSGIGRATALAFAKAGIHLALTSRSASKLDEVADLARQHSVDARTYSFDLSDVDQVKSKVQAIADDCGSVDVLVNNAGIGYTGELADTPLEDWKYVIDLNLTGVFQTIQAVLPGMRDRQNGVIVNVASIAGSQAFPGWGAYSVSKAGLIALSKILNAEERARGIRVITISPGAVNTPIWDTDTVQADFDRSKMLTPDVVAESILHAVLAPPHAVIEEMTIMPSAGAL